MRGISSLGCGRALTKAKKDLTLTVGHVMLEEELQLAEVVLEQL